MERKQKKERELGQSEIRIRNHELLYSAETPMKILSDRTSHTAAAISARFVNPNAVEGVLSTT